MTFENIKISLFELWVLLFNVRKNVLLLIFIIYFIIVSCVYHWFFSFLPFGSVASSLRTPMAVPCPYPTPFGIVPHAGMNGELTSPGAAYAGLHNISPQMSAAAAAAAAAAAYGRSPVVCLCTFTA